MKRTALILASGLNQNLPPLSFPSLLPPAEELMTTDRVEVRSVRALQTAMTGIFATGRLSSIALMIAPSTVSVTVGIANAQRGISETTALFHETVSSKPAKCHQHRHLPGDLQQHPSSYLL